MSLPRSTRQNGNKYRFPTNDLPLISIAKDKEASNTILYIFYKHDKLPNDLNRTIAGW